MVIEVSHGLVLWSVFSTQHPIELLQLLERYVALSPVMAAEKAIAKVPHQVPGDTARIQTRLVRPKAFRAFSQRVPNTASVIIRKDRRIPVFRATLLTIAKTGKQSKRPLTDERTTLAIKKKK